MLSSLPIKARQSSKDAGRVAARKGAVALVPWPAFGLRSALAPTGVSWGLLPTPQCEAFGLEENSGAF